MTRRSSGRRGVIVCVVLAVGGVLVGCSRSDSGNDGTGTSPGVASPMASSEGTQEAGPSVFEQGSSESDLRITQSLRQFVVGDLNLSADAVNMVIITKDGRVVLRGNVKSAEEKRKIDAQARRTPWVTEIDDQLVIEP